MLKFRGVLKEWKTIFPSFGHWIFSDASKITEKNQGMKTALLGSGFPSVKGGIAASFANMVLCTLPKTNIENQWLETILSLWPGLFSGANY